MCAASRVEQAAVPAAACDRQVTVACHGLAGAVYIDWFIFDLHVKMQ